MIPSEGDSRAWMLAWRQTGDATAGRKFIEAFYPFVASLIRKHVADSGAIEDLVQQTFARCFGKASQWKSSQPLEPWLARIAINLCRDHYRSRRRTRELRWSDLGAVEQAAMEATVRATDADSEISDDDSRQLLHRLLDTLNADERMVLSLIYFEERSTDQIARVTGWSRTLVKVRAFRARRELRQAFEGLEQSRT